MFTIYYAHTFIKLLFELYDSWIVKQIKTISEKIVFQIENCCGLDTDCMAFYIGHVFGELKMLNSCFSKNLNFKAIDRHDIQIFYVAYYEKTGHYITTFYNADTKIVHVLDSLICAPDEQRKQQALIYSQIKDRISNLYPLCTNIEWKIPKTTQNDIRDESACGIMSIAYTYLIIKGFDPTLIDLPQDKHILRQYVSEVFKNEMFTYDSIIKLEMNM